MKQKSNGLKITNISWVKLLPVFITVVLVPAIMKLRTWKTGYSDYPWYSVNITATDTALSYKAIVFSIVAFVMLVLDVIMVIRLEKKERISFIKKFWPILVYAVFVIISTVFSENIRFSLFGEYDQMEPVFVLLGYVASAVYVFLVCKDEKDVDRIFTAFSIGAIIVATIGILQHFGFDLYAQSWMRYIILSAKQREIYGELISNSLTYVASSLFNSNYVGTYVAVLLPICFFLVFRKTGIWRRILGALASVELVAFLVYSESKTGILVVAFTAVVVLIFFVRPVLRFWFIFIPCIIALIIGAKLFDDHHMNHYSTRIRNALHFTKTAYDLDGIDTSGNCVRVMYKGSEIELYITEAGGAPSIHARENGKNCEVSPLDKEGKGKVTFSNGSFDVRIVTFQEEGMGYGIMASFPGKFTFARFGSDYKIYNNNHRSYESVVDHEFLYGYDGVASGRGYVWGTALSRLKENLILGTGPDTFPVMLYSGGVDYARYWNAYGTSGIVFTRPHNLYIQVASNTGILSLISMIVFFVLYIIDCFKLYFFKKKPAKLTVCGVACLASVIGFLGCGIANDSLITVTPLFYISLGLGMVVNFLTNKHIDDSFSSETK